MDRQQEFLLKMLCEIHEICECHGIRYCIVGGTLIGAARNGGFLPWDDDADIAMPYDDYVRFVEACKTETPADRKLCDPALDESYRRVMPRWISTDTTTIKTTSSLHDDVAGEVIDIFVLDPIADGEKAHRDYISNLYLYSSIVSYANANGTRAECDPELYREMRRLVDERGRLHVNRLLEARMLADLDEAGENYAYRWKGWQGLLKRSWFEHPKPVEFEGRTLLAPENADAFLRAFFGEEWFDIPARVSPTKHKSAASLDFPSSEALEFYRPTYDRAELMAECEERIALRLDNAVEANAVRDEGARVKGRAVALEVATTVEANRALFDDALERRDGELLAALLRDYLDFQISKQMAGRPYDSGTYRFFRPLLIDVDDEVLDAALVALSATRRMSHAARLLDIARAEGRARTRVANEVAGLIDDFHACTEAYERGDFEDGAVHARRLVEARPHASEFHMLLCAHLRALSEAGGGESRPEWEEAVARARAAFPDDGFFMKHEADLMWNDGDRDGACALYPVAAELTRNGFALRDIALKCGYYPHWLRDRAWARAVGVPQWEGAEPEVPKPAPDPVATGVFVGTREHYLLKLLAEAAALCRDSGAECAVNPALARALAEGGALPTDVGAYTLICSPRGLAKVVSRKLPERRRVRYMGNDLAETSRRVRYYGTDSLRFSFKHRPAEPTGLFVTLVPLECPAYDDKVGEMLEQWLQPHDESPEPAESRPRLFARKDDAQRKRTRAGARLFRRAMACSARSLEAVVDLPRRVELSPGDVFAGIEWVEVLGLLLPVSPYLARGDAPAGARDLSLSEVPKCDVAAASGCTFDEFVASGGIDEGYFERRRAINARNAVGEAAFRRFLFNFKQIQLAVRLKELSLSLLPRKDEILALHEAGDYDALGEILGDYLQCARKFKDAGEPSFDDELYEVMMDVRAKLGR